MLKLILTSTPSAGFDPSLERPIGDKNLLLEKAKSIYAFHPDSEFESISEVLLSAEKIHGRRFVEMNYVYLAPILVDFIEHADTGSV